MNRKEPSHQIAIFEYGSPEYDAFMERIRTRTASKEEQEEFDLRVIERFCQAVYAGDAPPQWIMNYLANQLYKVLLGGDWEDELQLPWTQASDALTPGERKGLQIYADVENARRRQPDTPITAILDEVAHTRAVSYQTARDRYYEWRRRVSKSRTADSE